MNLLKTFTLPTDLPDTYLVYWTNSAVLPKGVIKVRILAQLEDRQIVAELAAMRHLLADKGVVGKTIVGNAGTKLIVSSGAIRKLQAMKSNKSHLAPYANFLTTRFAGCPISVDKDTGWFDGFMPDVIENLLVNEPCREALRIAGLGDVSVTHHVLERIADRILSATENSAQSVWKKLVELASDSSVREVSRRSLWAGIKNSGHGKHEGRYFLNPRYNLILVITDNPREGKRLVTTYRVTQHFQALPKAA